MPGTTLHLRQRSASAGMAISTNKPSLPQGPRRARRINPHRPPGRLAWFVQFRHPLKANKKVKATLKVREETAAKAICRDLSALCSDPALWEDPRRTGGMGFSPRAIEIFFGFRPPPADVPPAELAFAQLAQISKECRERIQAWRAAEASARELSAEVEELRIENARLRRRQNLHVRVALGSAIEAWKAEYPAGHARQTVSEAFLAADRFTTSLPKGGRTLIGTVRAGDVDRWLAELRSAAGAELSPVTKRKNRAYLSAFWSWAVRRYDLSEHPIAKSASVAGVMRNPERIVAMRHEEDLVGLVLCLKPWPYWQAFVSFAVLAGPRWGEQISLRVRDVYLAERYIRITSSKTGRVRSTPVERTILLPILKRHVIGRGREMRGRTSGAFPLLEMGLEDGKSARTWRKNEGQRSEYLFPSILPPGTRKRRLTPPGRWSGSSNFLKAWRRAARRARERALEDGHELGDWINFGPREWRHCAGTAMGHAGYSSLQISQWLGNSEAMCRRHYIAPTSSERWNLKW